MFFPQRPRLNPGFCPNCNAYNGIGTGTGSRRCKDCGVTFDAKGRFAHLPKMKLRWKIWFGFLILLFVVLPILMRVLGR